MTSDDGALVLIVEDEAPLAETVQFNLEREGYRVVVAEDGRRGIDLFRQQAPALIILDLMLPEVAGLDVCRAIRAESDVPIIMVTAKDSEADKVAGLELGADDYVTKPFSVRELVSRVRANLRRSSSDRRGRSTPDTPTEILAGGPVEMDVARHEVRVRGADVRMPPREFQLLEMLLAHPGRLLTREFLIEGLWGADYIGDTKTLDVHIKRLRAKVERQPHEPVHLLTVRGLGYKFVP
ncbi:MAG: response regulator transcription factor [Actinomycetota bacterium]